MCKMDEFIHSYAPLSKYYICADKYEYDVTGMSNFDWVLISFIYQSWSALNTGTFSSISSIQTQQIQKQRPSPNALEKPFQTSSNSTGQAPTT